MLITLTEDHQPTAKIIAMLRRELPRRFPGVTFSSCPPTSPARSSTSARPHPSTCR
jgi:hypothetical protein